MLSLCQLLSGIIGFSVQEVHLPYLKDAWKIFHAQTNLLRVTPYGVNLGDGGQPSILHTLMVYKVDDCFPRIPDKARNKFIFEDIFAN